MAAVLGGHAEPVLEQPQDVVAHRDTAEQRERRFRLQRREQAAERIGEALVAEILEAGAPRRFDTQRRRVEPDERKAERAQRAAGGVESAERKRLRRRRERPAGGQRRGVSSVTWLPGATDSISQTLLPTVDPAPITVLPPRIVAPA
jgi:hypothetical protein